MVGSGHFHFGIKKQAKNNQNIDIIEFYASIHPLIVKKKIRLLFVVFYNDYMPDK